MFALFSKLAEILAESGQRLLAHRGTGRDTDVAAAILRCVTALQDLCVRGGRLLVLAGAMADGSARPGAVEEFAHLVEQQADAVASLRSALADTQALLATVDPGIYLDLVPFLDVKSGLMTRWGQQAALSRFSTTTLFFLPAETLDRIAAVGREHATPDGLAGERSEFLLAVAEAVRSVRAGEVRDLSRAVEARHLPAVTREIAAARADLDRTGVLCGRLLAATQEAVGPEAMARLRRRLVPKPSGGEDRLSQP